MHKGIQLFLFGLAGIILLVFLYGWFQYPKAKGINHLKAERIVQAPKTEVWSLVSDVANYHKVTSKGVHDVKILEGEGLGMRRQCTDHKGKSWEETCTLWDEGNAYEFIVHTEKEGYHLPFKSLQGNWTVDSLGVDKSRISLIFSYEFKQPFVGGLFHELTKKEAHKDIEILLDNWQQLAEKQTH